MNIDKNDNTNIPESLLVLNNNNNIFFKNNRIYYIYYSLIENILFSVFLGFHYHFLIIILLNKYIKVNSFISPLLIFNIGFIVFIGSNIGYYIVIDYINKEIYKELKAFGKSIAKFKVIKTQEISQIGNNVSFHILNPYGRNSFVSVNPKTNLFHVYYVSFLLKNGEIVDYIKVGPFDVSYKESKIIAKALADYWNIPRITCNDNETLDTHNNEDGGASFIKEEIPMTYYRNYILSLILLLIIIFSIYVFFSK